MPPTAYDLGGRTAFVTGAAGGIGRASAVLLAEAGATVHCADLDADGLDGTVALIKERGGTARPHVLDVTDRPRLARAVRSCGSWTCWPRSPGSCTAARCWRPGTRIWTGC